MNSPKIKKIFLTISVILLLFIIFILIFLFKQVIYEKALEIVSRPILKIEDRGGMAGDSYILIFENGYYSRSYIIPPVFESKYKVRNMGKISNEKIETLTRLIKETDFKSIIVRRNVEICLSLDSGYRYYTFYEVGQEFNTCSYDIDSSSPVFAYINKVLNEIYHEY